MKHAKVTCTPPLVAADARNLRFLRQNFGLEKTTVTVIVGGITGSASD